MKSFSTDEEYEFGINIMELKEDHVHIFYRNSTPVFTIANSPDSEKHLGQKSV